MANWFGDTFNPSPDKKRKMDELAARVLSEALERRKHIRLVKNNAADETASPLYNSEPFGGFTGDCEFCDHYRASPFAFVTGGDCRKHRRGCGYGFTCKDNTSDLNNGWDEFEKIKREA